MISNLPACSEIRNHFLFNKALNPLFHRTPLGLLPCGMAPTRVFGWIAVSLSLVYKFPQIWKLHRTGDIRGISVESQIVQSSAYFFYITHGFVIGDPPIVFLGFTSLLQSTVLICQYFYHYKKKRKEVGFEEDKESPEKCGNNGNQEAHELELTEEGAHGRSLYL